MILWAEGPKGSGVKVGICRCAVCGNTWIPAKGDPREIDRCSSCKSRRWNSDDPKSTQKQPTEAERAKQMKNKSRRGKTANQRKRLKSGRADDLHAGDTVPYVTGHETPRLCRHRVLKSDCQICGNSA